MSGSDETMRLVAELLDKTSGPLKDIQKSLRETHAIAKKLQDQGTEGAKEHAKSYHQLHSAIERSRRELTGAFTPAMAALGISTFGVGEALGKVVESLKAVGVEYNVMNDISKRAGMSVDAVRQLSVSFERLGISQETAVNSAAEFGEHMDKLQRGTNSEENLAWVGGAYKALGDTLKHTPSRAGQLDAIFTFFSSHPNIPVDQKRKFYEELLHLPPELATKTGEELREALAAGLKYMTEHPDNPALGKALSRAFSDLRWTLHGINDDMVEAFGGDGAKLVVSLTDAIKHNIADIKQMRDDWMALVDKVGRGLGFRSDDPNDPAQKEYDKKHPENPLSRSLREAPTGTFTPMSFTSGGAGDKLAESVKTGMLAAFREWFASTGAGGSGYQRANYGGGGGSGGGGSTGGAVKALNAFHDGGGFKVMPDGNDNTGTNGGEGAMGDGNAGATSFDRTRFAAEIAANPALKEKIFQLSAGEDRPSGGSSLLGNQAVMESMMNRAANRHTTLAAQAKWTRGRYGDRNGYYDGKPSRLSASERANSESNLKAVLAGSNITDYATDNSSGGLAARERASGKFKFHRAFHGESFFSPGWAEPGLRDRYSAMRQGDLLTAAKAGGFTGGGTSQKVTGDASLSIDLNGFPKGTRTDLTYGGLFTSYSLSRGRQMEASEQK
jgi:hypothetical protein